MKQQTNTIIRYPLSATRYTKRAFTLMEMLIVVAILGILAAIILQEFQTQSELAKEAAAKDNLRILRNAVELYAAQHSGIPPGYTNNNPSNTSGGTIAAAQLTKPTNASGQYDQSGSAYRFGPYLKTVPKNPFTWDNRIVTISTSSPSQAGSLGWLYNPSKKKVYLNWHGTDKNGIQYINY